MQNVKYDPGANFPLWALRGWCQQDQGKMAFLGEQGWAPGASCLVPLPMPSPWTHGQNNSHRASPSFLSTSHTLPQQRQAVKRDLGELGPKAPVGFKGL